MDDLENTPTVKCGACDVRLPRISLDLAATKGPEYEAAMAVRVAHIKEKHDEGGETDADSSRGA